MIVNTTDTYGRIIHTQNVNAERNDLFINTSNWSAGTYFAQLQGSGWKAKPIRFVVAK